MNSNLTLNLRFLTGHYSSIAEVCRRIGLNRQQFNKYLNGQTKPGQHTLQRICDFFGVEDYELLMPNDEFRALVNLRPRAKERDDIDFIPPYVHSVENLFAASRPDIVRYLGYYFTYRISFSKEDFVLKSIVHLWEHEGRVLQKRVERFIEHDGHRTHSFLWKYDGYLFYLGDRLYIVEREILGGEELSQTVLYPSHRNHVTWLSGLNIGVSTRNDRRIGCGQILFQYIGTKVDLRAALKCCGKHHAESEEVPNLVRETLCQSEHKDGKSSLFAILR